MKEVAKPNRGSEDGFTLIELLVVVVIVGILAATAIPTFMAQRERAWEAAVRTDLRNAAIEMEAYRADNGGYGFDGLDDRVGTNGVNLSIEAIDAINELYCLEAWHDSIGAATTWTYDSSAGGLGPKGSSC